ncbi:MAG: recombinase family protein [Sandaracinaceae bacterium]|nr:recombinase family protein [Sandaracinaceae bacterium]
MKKRVAIYLRVSRGEQALENQRPAVARLVRARKLKLVATYEEKGSAVKARPQFDRMMRDAHAGAFDVLAVWSLDRLGRSMVGNVQAVLELDRRGVEVLSVREPWLDTGGPVRELLLAIFGWMAEQERAQISERTKAGLERARRKRCAHRPARATDRSARDAPRSAAPTRGPQLREDRRALALAQDDRLPRPEAYRKGHAKSGSEVRETTRAVRLVRNRSVMVQRGRATRPSSAR